MGERIILTAGPTVHLLIGGSNPNGVDTEFVEIVELLCQTLEVAAMESGHVGIARKAAAVVRIIIRCVTVVETVGKYKIDSGVLPGEILLTYHLGSLDIDRISLGGVAAPDGICDDIVAAIQRGKRMVGHRDSVEVDSHGGIRSRGDSRHGQHRGIVKVHIISRGR